MEDTGLRNVARDQFQEMMKTISSKSAVKAFLFARANSFLHDRSAKAKDGSPLVSRKDRRFAARQIAKRLAAQAVAGTVKL